MSITDTVSARKRILELQKELARLEELKKLEPKYRKELETLEAKVEEWTREEAFFDKPIHTRDSDDEDEVLDEESKKRKLKKLNKQLQQIAALKTKGDNLDPEAKAKVTSEQKILDEIARLKNDGDVDIDVVDVPAQVELPTDSTDIEKRLRNLRKKLSQIESLKTKATSLDTDAQAKIAMEHRVRQEIAALEKGQTTVEFAEPTQEEKNSAEKLELEKKLKAINKKLSQIDSLKQKGGNLDADAQSKVSAESGLKKEAHQLNVRVAELNKIERERVAERLGWTEAEGGCKKKSGKK